MEIEELEKIIFEHLLKYPLKSFPLENYSINYQNYIKFNKNKYNKIKLCCNSLFEIILICWDKNSLADFHHHPKNGCKLKVLSGLLQESLKDNFNNIKISNLKKNNVSYLDDTIGTHLVLAVENTVSLHIYSPPNFYD